MATTLTAQTTVCFFRETPPALNLFIQCAWYTLWVLIPNKNCFKLASMAFKHSPTFTILTTHLLNGAHFVVKKKAFYTYSAQCAPRAWKRRRRKDLTWSKAGISTNFWKRYQDQGKWKGEDLPQELQLSMTQWFSSIIFFVMFLLVNTFFPILCGFTSVSFKAIYLLYSYHFLML